MYKREREREKKEREKSKDIADALSRENEENAKLHSSKATDADKPYIVDEKPCIAYIAHPNDSGSIKAELQQVEEARAAKEAHFKTPVYCAACGEDLTGKGQLTKDGKTFCPKPGCGYPAREASA